MTFWVAALLAWMLAFCTAALATGEEDASAPWGKRVALVVGNGTYTGRIETLKNATNDAEAIAGALRDEHFDVNLVRNADLKGFQAALKKLEQDAKSADVVLFYYSGHGFQLGGQNYLVPTNAVLDNRDVIDSQTIRLDDIISQLDSPDHQTLILLDACRNNPLPASVRGNESGDGLAQVTRMLNTYVAFSTQPGNVSVDGTGSNSPFARALVDNMNLAGESISNVMVKVRRSVLEATNNLQQPFEQSTLTDYFYFNPAMQTRVTFKLPGIGGPAAPTAEQQPATPPKPPAQEEIPVIVASLPTGQERSVPDVDMVEPPSFEMIDITPAEPAATAQPQQPETQVAELPTTVETPAQPDVTQQPPDVAETPPPSDLPDNLEMAIQQQLKDVGCYNSTVDGAWGNGSRSALSDFFKAKKEPVTTDPTAEVYYRLKGESGKVCETKVATPQPPKQPPTTQTNTPKPPKQPTTPTTPASPPPKQPNFNGGGIGVFR